MESEFYKENKMLIFKITDEIDDCNAQKIRRKADYEIERFMPREVIFDFNRVTFMDSAGIGMVIGRYKQASLIGGKTEVTNLSDGVRKIFKMSGVLKIIPEVDLEERLKTILSKENSKEVINLWIKEIRLQTMK